MRKTVAMATACAAAAVLVGSVPAAAQCVGKWSQRFADGGVSGYIYTMTTHDDGTGAALYIGGNFAEAGGVPISRIAKWSGSCWEPLGMGQIDNRVNAMVSYDDGTGAQLYVGGYFTEVGGLTVGHIARWDGIRWRRVGEGFDAVVHALMVYDDGTGAALYAAGDFTTADGVSADGIAKWTGSAWVPLGAGLTGSSHSARALGVYDDGVGSALYVGGAFAMAGDVPASNIARWDGTAWEAVGSGSDGIVNTLAVYDAGSGAVLMAGGEFTTMGGSAASHIAAWDGATWSALGAGITGGYPFYVHALTVYDDGSGPALYVGGQLSSAGDVVVNNIARWDGSDWYALGSGTVGGVEALLPFDSGDGLKLYVGGRFVMAGDFNTPYLSTWDGVAWRAMGNGMDNAVRCLHVADIGAGPTLFAGGSFTTASGRACSRVARWDGAEWQPLANGRGTTLALVGYDNGTGSALYAGGPGGVGRWDGVTWAGIGGALPSGKEVRALAVYDSGTGPKLYAGGSFDKIGSTVVNYVAMWNGTSWQSVGGGMSSGQGLRVSALAVFDDGGGPELYAAGWFGAAGGVSASRIAKWNGSGWSALGLGIDGEVYALAVYDDGTGPALYAAGVFQQAGGSTAYGIARWDGTDWSAVGGGLSSGAVYSLAVADIGDGPALYAGGAFTVAGGAPAGRVARWDGSSWSALGAGANREVDALAGFDDGSVAGLYAGGTFSLAGGYGVRCVGRWECWSSTLLPGDTNCDGVVDYGDINPFVCALVFEDVGYYTYYPECHILNADINEDGRVDFADINPFVDMLVP